MGQFLFLYRITVGGDLQYVDSYVSSTDLTARVSDQYLADSPVGERYFIINKYSPEGIYVEWRVEGEKRLVQR